MVVYKYLVVYEMFELVVVKGREGHQGIFRGPAHKGKMTF